MNRMPVEQISPNKEVNFRDTTAAFTLAPGSGASPCRASSPGDWALYAVSVSFGRLRTSSAHRFALRLPRAAHTPHKRWRCAGACAACQTVPRGSALAFG